MKENIAIRRQTVLITGSAGFIGSALAIRLLTEQNNIQVVGIDNMNDYYDVELKEERNKKINQIYKAELQRGKNIQWKFEKTDISDSVEVVRIFEKYEPNIVVNLAAQAGVRYSISNPDVYIASNIIGFYNILEACRKSKCLSHLVFASSSSVYGNNKKIPYCIDDKTDTPVSLYAATKKSNEIMAYSYSTLYGIPVTGLRFFTVYGPMGRPDMAYYSFTEKLCKGETINIFNYGNCERDFTYIDDIITGIYKVITSHAPKKCISEDGIIPPYSIYNLGNHKPVKLMDFVKILHDELVDERLIEEGHLEERIKLVPMQDGDVPITYADMQAFEKKYEYRPNTELQTGLRNFVKWYKEYSKGS